VSNLPYMKTKNKLIKKTHLKKAMSQHRQYMRMVGGLKLENGGHTYHPSSIYENKWKMIISLSIVIFGTTNKQLYRKARITF